MRKVLFAISLVGLLCACEKNEEKVERTVELNNQWSINDDVKDIDANLFSLEEKSENGLYRAKWQAYTGAEIEGDRMQLNSEGSSLSLNLFYEELSEGEYTYLKEGEDMVNHCFTASYQLDYFLKTPVSANEILIVDGKLTIEKQEDEITLSFDLTDISGKRIKGKYTGKTLEQFKIDLENQWRIANKVLEIDANMLYFQESPADKVLNASLNLYTGAKFENGRLQFETKGSSITFSVNFTENIEGSYAFVSGMTNAEVGKFQAFYGKNYALKTPSQDDYTAIQSGSLIITKEEEKYNVHFELLDVNNQIIAGSYLDVLMPFYSEYISLLSGHDWSATAFYAIGEKQSAMDCMTDDVMHFNADGTYSTTVNESCDPSDPDEDETGTYRIEKGDLVIIPAGSDPNEDRQVLRIASISASKLILSTSIKDEDGAEVIYEYVME